MLQKRSNVFPQLTSRRRPESLTRLVCETQAHSARILRNQNGGQALNKFKIQLALARQKYAALQVTGTHSLILFKFAPALNVKLCYTSRMF